MNFKDLKYNDLLALGGDTRFLFLVKEIKLNIAYGYDIMTDEGKVEVRRHDMADSMFLSYKKLDKVPKLGKRTITKLVFEK